MAEQISFSLSGQKNEPSLDEVLVALNQIRIHPVNDEYELQNIVATCLKRADLVFEKEKRLGSRNRIDFLVSGGIGIEIKKGKPYAPKVVSQVARYIASPEISIIIVVVQRYLDLPKEMDGKKVIVFGLHRLWGVTI